MTKAKTPLEKSWEANRDRGSKTKSAVLDIIKNADQPLVSGEVHAMLVRDGIVYDRSYVLQLLHNLVSEGLLSSRVETPDERAIRTTDGRGAHLTAIYFWAPAGKVPFRTKPSTVNMIKRSKKKSAKTVKPVRKTVTAPASNSDLISRIESMTNELALLQRVAELEKQLADIRRVVR